MKKILLALLIFTSPAYAEEVCDNYNSECLDFEQKLAEVRAIPDLRETEENNDLVFRDDDNVPYHIFTSEKSDAYPSYLRMNIVERNRAMHVSAKAYTGRDVWTHVFQAWPKPYMTPNPELSRVLRERCKTCKKQF